MSFTTSQHSAFKDHPNLKWLRSRVTKNQAVSQSIIKSKIKQAIESAFPNRATETNIRWVANDIGIFYGQVYKPQSIESGKVHKNAVAEIRGNDKHMAQAVRMIFQGTAKGRTAPGTTGINHIHVGGYGTKNILFDNQNKVVLGVVKGHIQKNMSILVRSQVDKVNKRKGGTTQNMQVVGDVVK
jgi:hypothetical protein